MPTSIIVNGRQSFQPGVRAKVDAQNIGGKALSVGNVAIVGEFPEIEAHASELYNSAQDVRRVTLNALMLLLARLAFTPSLDPRVPGGASSVRFANVQPNTAASVTLLDDEGEPSIVLTARRYGLAGNRIFYQALTNADDDAQMDVVLSKDGVSEQYSIGTGSIAEVWYSGTELTTTLLEVAPGSLVWSWTKTLTFTAPGGAQEVTYTRDKNRVDNVAVTLALVNGGAGASAEDVVVVITGLDHEGNALEVTKTAPAAGTSFTGGGTTTELWSRIDTVVMSTADTAYNGTLTISSKAFDIDTEALGFPSVGTLLAYINNNSNLGFNAVLLDPVALSIPAFPDASDATGAGGVDAQGPTTVNGSGNKMLLTANLWATAHALNRSAYVSARVATDAVKPPSHFGEDPATSEQGYLLGGSEGVTAGSDWDATLNALKKKNVQVLVIFDTTVTNIAKGVQHCRTVADEGSNAGGERQMYAAAPAGKTIAEVFSGWTAVLNSEWCGGICAQEIQIDDVSGRRRWFDPRYQAVQVAGMHCGTDIAEPITWKRPLVYGVRSSGFDPELEANTALQRGMLFYTEDPAGGWRVERDVTTYMIDDNPFYSAISAFESGLVSVRDLRGFIEPKIGTKITPSKAKVAKGLAAARLDEQVKRGWINAWRNLELSVVGDQVDFEYEFEFVEGWNFSLIRGSAARTTITL